MNKLCSLAMATSSIGALASTSGAHAQQPAVAQTQAQVQVQGTGAVGMPGQATAVAGNSDHDMMVGRFALGYMGRRSMLIGDGFGSELAGAAGAEQNVRVVNTPVIGVRYWINPLVGIDGGLGMYWDHGSNQTDLQPPEFPNTNPPVDQSLASTTSFVFHVGVPLALTGVRHFSFQVVPEANVGFATQSIDGAPNTNNSGFHLDIGARAGAEIHFGFIDIPELSLQASIGLLYALDNTKTSQGSSRSARHRGAIQTTVYDNPWNIFTSNVAALYYF